MIIDYDAFYEEFLKIAAHKDLIPGGLADNKKPEDFDQAALKKGIKVELEHTSSKDVATEIAMDHLTEDKSYYEKLEKMEKKAYEIKPSDRPDIAKKDFAQPNKEEAGHKGKYPIPDRQHAKSALGFAKMHGDSAAYAAVRAKVKAKYPDMLEKESSIHKAIRKCATMTKYTEGGYTGGESSARERNTGEY